MRAFLLLLLLAVAWAAPPFEVFWDAGVLKSSSQNVTANHVGWQEEGPSGAFVLVGSCHRLIVCVCRQDSNPDGARK